MQIQWLQYMLNLVCPARCPLCDSILSHGERPLCNACRGKLPWVRQPRCMRCSRPISDERQEYCEGCAGGGDAFLRAWAPFAYEKGMRDSILRMKFKNRREYLDFYAGVLATAGRSYIRALRPACILPVPMHPKKVRQRGFDQCRLLAGKLGHLTGIPVVDEALVRTRNTLPQKGLSGEDRRKNLAGAFLVSAPEKISQPVLLLDDIYTTGSTVDEIGRTLARFGITQVYVMTLCITRGR